MAAITFSNIGGDIHSHGQPVVALGVGFMCQCFAAWMISAYPIMEFYQYVLSMLLSEAFKIGFAQGRLIQLTVNKGELSCLDLDLVGFGSVIRQLPRT